MAKYMKTEQGYIDIPNFALAPFKPEGKSYLTFSSLNNFTLAVNDATKHWDGTLEYFTSDRTWATWDGTTALSAVYNGGEYVLYLRGTGNTVITGSSSINYEWVLTGTDIACVGNIENLLDYTTVESGAHPTMANCCYSWMFQGCTALTQAPSLPATTLANDCYSRMFQDCAALTQAPSLPATTLAVSCYNLMFWRCTALTQAPSLPATTLANDCYSHMFQGCTALTHAPSLPATTLANDCYNGMFQDCAALTHAPSLPATILANDCYSYMFYGCTSLTQAPALPATTLAEYCYNSMFYGCTSLTHAPALPATTLAIGCYGSIFKGCTSLKLSSTKTDEYTQEYRIPSSGNGTTAINAFNDIFASTGGTFTGTPSINITYYLSSDNMIVRGNEIATLNGYVDSMIDAAVPELDTTLSITGKSADAKATGDAIRALSEEIVTTSESKVAAHNTGTDTHSDIRLLIQGLTDRLNALADSDDTTLDQMSEVVAYIKSNKSLIDAITTSKVSVADIVDNLTTNVSSKPLSAAQGVAIKTLIDALRNSTYSKPSSGIPKTDLASDVQDSLTKVDNMAANVKDYGAIGDGVTDDTAALQLAFDSAAAQGGNLYIPEGDYKITGQLMIADPICVSGDGCLKLYDPDSRAEFAALTVDNGVRLSGLKLEAQEGFAGVILKYYPTSNTIYPSETRFKSLNIQSLSTQKILSYFDVYGGNNYGLIIEDVTIGKPNTARYCQYGMRILTEGGYAGAGASWENSGTVRNLRIDTRGDHQLYAVGASGGVVPKNWVFENIAIQANSKLQSGNAFTYQDSFYLYRFAEVTLRNCKVWDASAAAYADGRAPVVYEDIIATTYIDGCAPAFYLDSGAVVLSKATTPEVTAYRQQYVYDQLKEIAEKFDISSLTVSKTETDAETTLIFSDGTNAKSIAVSKVQMTDEQISTAIGAWMDANAMPTEVWSKNVLNVNDENVSMGYIAAAGQINNSDTYWVSGYIPAKQGDVLRSSLDGATANLYYVAEYNSAKGFLTRAAKSANTYTVTDGSTAYIRVSWKTSLVSYKNEKAMLTLNNTDLSFEAYGSHTEGGLGEYLILTSPNGTKYSLRVSDDAVLSAVPV